MVASVSYQIMIWPSLREGIQIICAFYKKKFLEQCSCRWEANYMFKEFLYHSEIKRLQEFSGMNLRTMHFGVLEICPAEALERIFGNKYLL